MKSRHLSAVSKVTVFRRPSRISWTNLESFITVSPNSVGDIRLAVMKLSISASSAFSEVELFIGLF